VCDNGLIRHVSLGVSICLDIVKQFVSTVEKISTFSKSSSRQSRNLDFVSTSMSRPKSLDRDREICRGMEILSFLDSLSRSRSRSKWIYEYFSSRFLNSLRLLSFSYSKCLHNVQISLQILIRLDNLDKNLDKTKSRLKSLNFKNLDPDKKKFISTGFKSLSRLSRPPGLKA
jgi:hypothetical protein